ncbi:MAG: hypothetical protein IPI49_33105 [Myxococcales bacterium]|nr:hypothetical protein [Myxococcales bacterium]
MAKIVTNRDRLDRIVDYFRKAARYWWLIAGIALVGGVLALLFAQSRPRKYQSWSVVFYQERIQSSVLRGSAEATARNIGERYRELLMSQSLLQQIVEDPKLNPFPELLATQGPDAAVEALRLSAAFMGRGTSSFRIAFIDEDPVRAQAVAAKLTELLNAKDDELRTGLAQRTAKFAVDQKEEASAELREREKALAEFLTKHPEFVQDTSQTTEGASIRAYQNRPTTSGNPRTASLERQRARILGRLNAKPGAPVQTEVAPSPERVAALAALAEVERDLSGAKRELEGALARYTDLHPTVVKARERVNTLQIKARQAEQAVPKAVEALVAPSTPEDRAALQRELKNLEDQIAAVQAVDRGKPVSQQQSAEAWIVELETQHADLRRAVAEQRSQVETLSDAMFRAQMQANQQMAEQGGRLSIVDPAFRPIKPHGSGKSVFILAGLVVFGAIGSALAMGLALIDDRIYRRDDLDELGLPVLAVVPPARVQRRRGGRSKAPPQHRAATQPPMKELSS